MYETCFAEDLFTLLKNKPTSNQCIFYQSQTHGIWDIGTASLRASLQMMVSYCVIIDEAVQHGRQPFNLFWVRITITVVN